MPLLRIRWLGAALLGSVLSVAGCATSGDQAGETTPTTRQDERDALLQVLSNPYAPPVLDAPTAPSTTPTPVAPARVAPAPVSSVPETIEPAPQSDRAARPQASAPPQASDPPAPTISADAAPQAENAEFGRETRRRRRSQRAEPAPEPQTSDADLDIDPSNVDQRIGTLPAQRLDPGACGLFLYLRRSPPRLIFFGEGGDARMQIDGKVVSLSRLRADGASFAGLYADQTFATDDYTIEIQVEMEQRPDIVGGVVVPRGRLRFQDAAGWSFVLPVGGIAACQETPGAP